MMQFHDGNRPPQPAMDALSAAEAPGWAMGLRKLYRAVAEDQAPSEFADLLARFEDGSMLGNRPAQR